MENKLPLALKYRPKKLDDVVGQDVAVRILKNSFKMNDWHHVYIFSGSKGSGKTTVARIMAMMENCENGPTLEPCGACTNCREIQDESSIDVRELDAASNRSIDDIRAIKENIYNCPIQSKCKYIIIDEAHGLTGQAADAALKMIEKPPSFARFILATTEPEALKDTIHSRGIALNFHNLDKSILTSHLDKICKTEGVECEEGVLEMIASVSENSARNSLQNLQTVVAYAGGEKIIADFVNKSLGAIEDVMYFRFIQNILEFNAPEAIKILNQIFAQSCNARKIVRGLVEHLRHLQLYMVLKDGIKEFGVSDENMKRFAYQSQKSKPSLVSKMIHFIIDVQKGLFVNMDAIAMLENLFVIPSIIEAVKIKKEEEK